MGPGSPMVMMRSFQRDPSVKGQKLAPGTVRRIVSFARPYKAMLIAFLVVLVIDSLVAVANPLVFKKIIDDGIGIDPPRTGDEGVVLAMALVLVGLAVFDAVLALIMRWYSARIG